MNLRYEPIRLTSLGSAEQKKKKRKKPKPTLGIDRHHGRRLSEEKRQERTRSELKQSTTDTGTVHRVYGFINQVDRSDRLGLAGLKTSFILLPKIDGYE